MRRLAAVERQLLTLPLIFRPDGTRAHPPAGRPNSVAGDISERVDRGRQFNRRRRCDTEQNTCFRCRRCLQRRSRNLLVGIVFCTGDSYHQSIDQSLTHLGYRPIVRGFD